MLDAVSEALEFTKDKNRDDLDVSRMLTLAIIKELEIVGEAASKLSPEFKSDQPHIPWGYILTSSNATSRT